MMDSHVLNLNHLAELANERRSVYYPQWGSRPMPAAVVMNMQARLVHNMLSKGLFVYTPKCRSIFKKAVTP